MLISGGDPLLMTTEKPGIVGRIARSRTSRRSTSAPLGLVPMRIDDELCRALRAHAPVFINTHFNHAKELTPRRGPRASG